MALATALHPGGSGREGNVAVALIPAKGDVLIFPKDQRERAPNIKMCSTAKLTGILHLCIAAWGQAPAPPAPKPRQAWKQLLGENSRAHLHSLNPGTHLQVSVGARLVAGEKSCEPHIFPPQTTGIMKV